MESHTVLLTGATSFLGRRLTQRLKKEECRLILTARHTEIEQNIIAVDLQNTQILQQTVANWHPEVVIHLGAFVDLSREFSIGKKCIEINTLGTMNLLDSVKDYKPFFIYVSSEEVYGNVPTPFKEDQRISPPSPYAISKAAAEQLCVWYGKEYSFPIVVVRLGTFYGPEQPLYKYFAQVIKHALHNDPIPCNSGVKKRDYLYVDDAVDLLTKIVMNGKTILRDKPGMSTIINGTGTVSYKLLDVINLIRELTGSSSEVKIGAIPDRITEREEWIADNTLAKQLFNWEPTTSLEEGLQRMIEYYKQNKMV